MKKLTMMERARLPSAREVTLLLLSLISVIAVSKGHKELPRTLDYGAYINKYGKYYTEVEMLARAQLFYARTLEIFKFNSLYLTRKNNYYLKQNTFTDMSPNEVNSMLSNGDSDLIPVRGSAIAPDMPADEFVEASKSGGVPHYYDYSHASLSVKKPLKSGIDFFHNSDDLRVGPRELITELVDHKDVAKQMDKVLDLEPHRKLQNEQKTKIKVPYKPIVRPNNVNYDPSLVPSYAWMDTVESASDNFAKLMMEDFAYNLQPYPTPEIPKGRVLRDEDLPTKSSLLADIMSSIQSIHNYLSYNNNDSGETQVDNEVNHKEPISTGGEPFFDIDWRRTGCISRLKSQSGCNSCYAFAIMDLMEFFYCRQKGTMTEFSVQYIIDCGHMSGLKGCKSGKLSQVGMFVQQYGLHMNAVYPYSARQNQCPFDEKSDGLRRSYALKPVISKWRMFPEIQAWYKWLPKSPIVVGINMPSDFLAYGGGIHDGDNCTPRMGHAMLLVGSGQQDGKTFWFLKNTFSDTWGEGGYFKLSKKAPIKCFESAIVTRVDFT